MTATREQDPGHQKRVGRLGCHCFIGHDVSGKASGYFSLDEMKEKRSLFTLCSFCAEPHKGLFHPEENEDSDPSQSCLFRFGLLSAAAAWHSLCF